MSIVALAPQSFVGRDEIVARFRSRLEHYNLFLYEGNPGVGKTTLVRRLAKETKVVGCKEGIFLQLVPGETVASVLARVEIRTLGKTRPLDRQGDPFGRLIETLTNQKVCLVLDNLHNLRREELPALVRSLRQAKGPLRVLSTIRGDPELSAMDIMLLHLERLGPLTAEEVRKVAQGYKLPPAAIELVVADAMRGGSTAQPLTLKLLATLGGAQLLPKEFLDTQTARSVNAFRAVLGQLEGKLSSEDKETLGALAAIGQPIAKKVATQVFGNGIGKLVERGLCDEIAGDIYVHHLAALYFANAPELSNKQSAAIATYLRERAMKLAEPLGIIRAGKLQAQAGKFDNAVETLADGLEAVRDLGFLEAYLKILASIPHEGPLGSRLSLLSARARMRQGNVLNVKEEMERLANERDAWTRIRALASLGYIYGELDDHKKAVSSFEALKKTQAPPELLLQSGSIAASAMLKLGQVAEAEKLGKTLLARLRGDQEPERQGELHRLLAHVYAQMGVLARAVEEAALAAKYFSQAGDLYHAANAHGFIGDLYRETGDFELAKLAFQKFHEMAQKWGDRNLLQIAELSEAWVSLDIGDLTSAQKRIVSVEKDLPTTASRRLRRYLSSARALLEAGRGHHSEAAEMLPKCIESWELAASPDVADTLRTQLVRSLLALGKIDEASEIVDSTLARLDAKTAAPRIAAFLREGALIRLKKKDVKRAMQELAQANKLFAQGGNRRDEAHTLVRIAQAALEDGDLELAKARAAEALELAQKIRHTRVAALARELQARIALLEDDVKTALGAAKESSAALKKLGDEIGWLHVSESLLRAQIIAGDLAGAIRLGPKVSEQAEALEIRDVRIRAIALTGVALLRKGRPDAAVRCFRELPDGAVQPATAALMWRLGEALAFMEGDKREAAARRDKWVVALRRLPEGSQLRALHTIEQLDLPPHERVQVRTQSGVQVLGREGLSWLDPSGFQIYVDIGGARAFVSGKPLELPQGEAGKLFSELVVAAPEPLTYEAAARLLFEEPVEPKKTESKVKPFLKDVQKVLKASGVLTLETKNGSMRLVPPKKFAFVVPKQRLAGDLSGEQRKILKLVRKHGATPLSTIEEQLKIERPIVKRELDKLIKGGLLQAVRDGRGQAFRLA